MDLKGEMVHQSAHTKVVLKESEKQKDDEMEVDVEAPQE